MIAKGRRRTMSDATGVGICRWMPVRWLALVALATVWSQPAVPAAETPPAGTIITVAGVGKSGYSGDGGPAVNAQFDSLHAVALDPAGRLYVLDAGRNVVRRIGADGAIST